MFIAAKILWFLLSPFNWLVALLMLAVFTKNTKNKKRYLLASVVVLWVFSNGWILTSLQYRFQSPPMPMSANERYEYGIVLGGMSKYDRVNKKAYFNMSSDRFIQTVMLHKKGHIKKIIVSGGQNGMFKEDDFVEAEFIANNLRDLGVPAGDLLIESRSRNTIENAQFSKKILASAGGTKTKTVLITSAFHIPRATATFVQEGFDIRPYPCAFGILADDVKFDAAALLPSGGVMDGWSGMFRELLGRAYLKVKALF